MAKKPTQGFGKTQTPEVAAKPFDIVYCDILSLPQSSPVGRHRHCYTKLIIFVDNLSRWIEAVPLPRDPDAEDVIEAFVEYVICRHGVPLALVCDRGSNLISQMCRDIYHILGIDLRPSTAYHHCTVGMVERLNRTLNELLRATGKEGRDWPLHIPWLLFMLRSSPHRVTKVSPASLVLGRELRLPPDHATLGEVEHLEPTLLALSDDEGGWYGPTALHQRMRIAWDWAEKIA